MKIVREYGWAHQEERREEIDETGMDVDDSIQLLRGSSPVYEVTAAPWLTHQFQASQGACQGNALAHMAQTAFCLATGVKRLFSQACGYYESQRHDGIRGDRGSTLAGGAKLMTEDGIMLDDDWKYPARYDSQRPSGFDTAPRLKMRHTKRLADADQIWAFLEAGGVVQTGVAWNSSFEEHRADRVQNFSGGGHSTMLFGLDPESPDKWCNHYNSWKNWGIDGTSRTFWSKNFINDCLKDRFAVFMGYSAIDADPENAIWDLDEERGYENV